MAEFGAIASISLQSATIASAKLDGFVRFFDVSKIAPCRFDSASNLAFTEAILEFRGHILPQVNLAEVGFFDPELTRIEKR